MLIQWGTEKIAKDSSLLDCYIVLTCEQLQMFQSIAAPSTLCLGNLFLKCFVIQDRDTTILHNITTDQIT
jgi:hypothetical protein